MPTPARRVRSPGGRGASAPPARRRSAGNNNSPARRAASASPGARPWRRGVPRFSPTGRGGSAPVIRRRSSGPNSPVRRAASASPGVRHWRPPRRARPSVRNRGPGRAAKALTGLLALQAVLGGSRVNTPYVGRPGKALAIWPLGSSGLHPLWMESKTYPKTELAKFPVVERPRGMKRRPNLGGRKLFLGGQPPREWYEPIPEFYKTGRISQARVIRKLGLGTYNVLPRPVINPMNVLRLEAAGFQLPKGVLKQAHAGKAIVSNFEFSNNMKEALARRNPRLLPALVKIGMPVQNRFGPNQLGGPRKKLNALAASAEKAAVRGTVRAALAPWAVAAKARNLTGRAAAAVARGARYTATLPGEGRRRLMKVLSAQERRLPN